MGEGSEGGGAGTGGKTVRARIAAALAERPHTALSLSGAVGVPEREVASHLVHLARSLAHRQGRFVVEPARCVACDFTFDESKLARPSRCPQCRAERIDPPRFSIE